MLQALERAKEAVEQETVDKLDEQTILMAAKVAALLVGYHAQYVDAGYLVDGVEQTWHLPIVNPSSGRVSRLYTQAGRFDGVVSLLGKRFLLEHKTTGEDISDPNATYWRRLAIDCQVSMYGLACWQAGEKVDGTLYDVIRKPTIRPKEIPKGSTKKGDSENVGTLVEIESKGTYYGGGIRDETLEAIRNGWLTREDAYLYHHRLVADIFERPSNYYQRRIVPRLDSDLVEWAEELWDVTQEIHHAIRENRHYRNSEACTAYNHPCEYLGLCSGQDTPESDTWRQGDGVHQELGVEYNDRVITCSRIKCFQTCRRKHYWRYVQKLRKTQDEDSEALHFGRLLHIGLEAWFNTFKREVTDDNCTKQLTASGVASSAGDEQGTWITEPSGDPWG